MNLDRFAYGLPDLQEDGAAPVGRCATCKESIYFGERVIEDDGLYFCNADCYLQATDARWIIAGTGELA